MAIASQLNKLSAILRLGSIIAAAILLAISMRWRLRNEPLGHSKLHRFASDFPTILIVLPVYEGYCGLILGENTEAAIREKAQEIIRASEPSAALPHGPPALSQKLPRPGPVNLNTVVENSAPTLRRVVGASVQLVTSLGRDLRHIGIDTSQLEQILMIMAINSREAMPQGGVLTIETGTGLPAGYCSDRQPPLPAQSYVSLSVRDTGCGMDASIVPRIFEPFFTTKAMCGGTGQSLSFVDGIVKQAGGRIFVESELGRGTTFTIHFPGIDGDGASPRGESGQSQEVPAETILVVEDNSGVLQLICAVLQRAGYCVLTAHNGREALEICRTTDTQIQLVITDMVMPEMNGPALLKEVRRAHLNVRVIYISGYPNGMVGHAADQDSSVPFIQKPFSAESLLRKIREVLEN
jgi:two-component system cell cycle sensor histidine kinase/response regulator CckA